MKKYFILPRLSLILIIASLITTNSAMGVVANTTPFTQGKDLLYLTLELLKLKGLTIKEERGKIIKFIDQNKLTEGDWRSLETLERLWTRGTNIRRAVNIEKHGITLSDKEQCFIFDDIERIKQLHKNTNSFMNKINSKYRSKILYSFKAKDHILCSDLYSHNLITSNGFSSIKKKDRTEHINLLKLQCESSYQIFTRERYSTLTETLTNLDKKTDTDIFLNYTPINNETDTATSVNLDKKIKIAKRKNPTEEGIKLIPTTSRTQLYIETLTPI